MAIGVSKSLFQTTIWCFVLRRLSPRVWLWWGDKNEGPADGRGFAEHQATFSRWNIQAKDFTLAWASFPLKTGAKLSAVHWAFIGIHGCSGYCMIKALDFQGRISSPSELLKANACLVFHHIPAVSTVTWPIEGAQRKFMKWMEEWMTKYIILFQTWGSVKCAAWQQAPQSS